MSDFPAAVRRLVRNRSRGICEGCGLAPAADMHHCQYRSRLGPSTAGNALHLCGWGNTSGCHGVAHDGMKGEELGWSIRSGHEPLFVPKLIVVDFVERWALFDDLGGRKTITAAEAVARLVHIGARKAA
ncbi:MAG: hypothetical protein JWP85_2099 [Rhodoglobus sp.]|nr:hypothetical protein [Rhodoglobus sp.]